MSNTVQKFGSVSEFLDFIESDYPESTRGMRNASKAPSSHWYGDVDWEQSIELAESGWSEGRELIQRFSTRITTKVAGMIALPEVHYDVTGMELDIGKYLSGDPECCMDLVDGSVKIEARPSKFVKIVANISASASQSADSLTLRGAAIVVLTQTLERYGIRCSVDLCAATDNHSGVIIETRVRVKNFEDQCDLDRLVVFLAHPASLRRYMFAAWEHMARDKRNLHNIEHGYGKPTEVADRGDIYLGSVLSEKKWSEQSTVNWIVEQLSKQGVELVAQGVGV